MSSWRECKLGDVATFSQGIQVPLEEQQTEIFENSVRFIRIVDFTKGGENEIRYIKNPGERYLVNSDDLVMIRYGSQTAGKIARGFNGAIANNTFKITPEENVLNKNFLYYFLSQKSIFDFFHYSQASSTMPAITFGMIGNLDLEIPPLEEQKAIAEVLSSLDDKIDLLHCQNQTLESLSQTLFRQWFIEEAKEEWEEKPLSKIAYFLNGLACQKFPPQNDIEKLPVLKIKDLKDGISENSDYATSDVKPEYIVNNGEVIFAWSASLMVKIWDGEQCVLNQHLFKVTSKDFPKWFYYHWCKYHLDNFIAISSAHATTMGHIKRGDLDEAMCVIPSNEELIKMDDEISPIFEKIETNSRQIKSLEKMRDTLLPKLLSGEVRVEI